MKNNITYNDVEEIMQAVAFALVRARDNRKSSLWGVESEKWEEHLLNLARLKLDLKLEEKED
jgi:hypothetical protein